MAKVLGVPNVELQPRQYLTVEHNTTKRDFHDYCRRSVLRNVAGVDEARELKKLPNTFAELEAMDEAWCRQVWPTENKPEPFARTNLDDALKIHMLYNCRRSIELPGVALGGSPPAGAASSAIMQVGAMFAEGLKALQQSQTHFMEQVSQRALLDLSDGQTPLHKPDASGSPTAMRTPPKHAQGQLALDNASELPAQAGVLAARSSSESALSTQDGDSHPEDKPCDDVMTMLHAKAAEQAPSMKRPAASSVSRSATSFKRPAACPAAFASGQKAMKLPTGWKVLQPYKHRGRSDKCYVDKAGNKYYSLEAGLR
jgi:hypothetical protein